MQQRRVSARQIARTLNNPDRVFPSRGALVAERRTDAGNTLRVIYVEREGGSTAYVSTVYRMGGSTR